MNRKFKMKFILVVTMLVNHISLCISKPTSNENKSTTINEKQIDDNRIGIVGNQEAARIEYAQKMLSYMNQTIDPCDDFYEYACGNWKNVIAARHAIGRRNNIFHNVHKINVKQLLEKQIANTDSEFKDEIQLAMKFYESCLSANLYPFRGAKEYIDVIKTIGGFPALDEQWNPDEFNWFNMSSHLTNYGAEGLINENILPQYPYPPYFELPKLGFDSNVHTDNIASNETRIYEVNEARMRGYLETYGVSADKATEAILEIFDFWRAVLEVTDEFKEDILLCQLIEPTNFEKPFEQWNNHFAIAWNGIDFDLPEDDCPCEYFYLKLDVICNEHKRAVANYLAMKFLYEMDAKMIKKDFQEEYCVMAAHYGMPYLVEKLYLNEFFNEDIANEVTAVVKEQHKSLHSALTEAEWLDKKLREKLLRKESEIISYFGIFEDAEVVKRLIKEMLNLTFVKDNYEQNNIKLKQYKAATARYLGLHYETISNETKPLKLPYAMKEKAFYDLYENSINIIASVLHPPWYHTAWPYVLKFATIGVVVGHEFTHGFDSNGIYFDSTGQQQNNFSEASEAIFKERVDCFINHYSSYLVPEINLPINGNLTRDENIADSGGLHLALLAYHRYMQELENSKGKSVYNNESMPGISLSPEQLFFLGFAQLWCADYKEEHYWEELRNTHTIDKYRVLGALTNIQDFAKSYNCPLGSKMNPTMEKCRLW